MASNKEMFELCRKARKAGMHVERDGGGHWLITAPNGNTKRIPFSPGAAGSIQRHMRETNKFIRENGKKAS